MPKVFITNDSGQNYQAAEQFGDLVRLTRGPVDIFHPNLVQRIITSKLEEGFDNLRDFVLIAGAALPCALLFAELALRGKPTSDAVLIKCLMFDVKTQKYILRTVAL